MTECTEPDVTVIVAVYNTMPYLTDCLASVVGQSIGLGRLQVVAVDDGSTDGSGAELDRWAERYPGTVTVIHQDNSGGPAAPSNRGLEVATGRYVFFVGADDYLGVEALERLVTTADELDADIVLGRLVGAGGRKVSQAVFKANRDDIDLVNSPLPWALSNTKLFRRSMLERHGIRYPEDLLVGSDQPFTLRAVVAARRIAVRADYDFYYAVRRTDSSNITYRTSPYGFVESTAVIMNTVADVVADPAARERVLRRHFSWELVKVLGECFLAAEPAEQERVQAGVRKLADAYLTDTIRDSLDVHRRILVSVAQYGTLDDLVAVARHYAERGLSPLVVDGERCYAALPGFRDPDRGFADSWYDATPVIRHAVRRITGTGVRWGRTADGRRTLVVEARSELVELDRFSNGTTAATVGDRSAALTLAPEPDQSDGARPGTVVRAEFLLDELIVEERRRRARRVRFSYTVLEQAYTRSVTGLDLVDIGQIRHRRGLRHCFVSVRLDRQGRLVVVTDPVTPRRVAGSLVRRLRRLHRSLTRTPRQGGEAQV